MPRRKAASRRPSLGPAQSGRGEIRLVNVKIYAFVLHACHLHKVAAKCAFGIFRHGNAQLVIIIQKMLIFVECFFEKIEKSQCSPHYF